MGLKPHDAETFLFIRGWHFAVENAPNRVMVYFTWTAQSRSNGLFYLDGTI